MSKNIPLAVSNVAEASVSQYWNDEGEENADTYTGIDPRLVPFGISRERLIAMAEPLAERIVFWSGTPEHEIDDDEEVFANLAKVITEALVGVLEAEHGSAEESE